MSREGTKDKNLLKFLVSFMEYLICNIANSLDNNTSAKGRVTIFSELSPCESCQGVAKQFMERYPNIEVEILSNGGRLPPSRVTAQ